MADPVLEVEDLRVSYRVSSGSFEVLHDVDLAVEPGGVVGVVGESGCGKSTLAAAMLRLLPPNGRITGGRLALHGRDVLALSDRELREVRGNKIGMIFQDPLTSLNPTFRVSTQMVNAQRAHPDGAGRGRDELKRAAVEMLERVGIPEPERRIDDYPHQFSGGMRQRIMVATTLLLRPDVLVCDEATSALDVTIQAQILNILTDLCREQGTALVVISHDIGVIGQLADQVLVLYAGRVVESGAAADVLTRPQHPYTRKLLAAVPSRHRREERLATIPGRVPSLSDLPTGCTFADRCYAAQDTCRSAEPPLVRAAGVQVRCLLDVRDAASPAADPVVGVDPRQDDPGSGVDRDVLLRTNELRVHFTNHGVSAGRRRTVKAVDGVDLSLGRGEIVGLVGESGSGKTTLGKALLRLAPVTGGEVTFEGVDLAGVGKREWRRVRRGLQMIFQEPYGSLSPRLRVDQLVTEPYRINKTPEDQHYPVDELLDLVGLSTEQAAKYPHQLSGGQARRVGIARALAMQPAVVIADEPTAGLDVSAAAAILNLLTDLRARLSLSLLIITHDLNVVGYVADRIAVMKEGRIVEIDTADRVMDAPEHPYTKNLLASIPELPH